MEITKTIEPTLEPKINSINKWAGSISGFMLVIISLITAYDIIMRYVFNKPTGWTMEYSIYLFIWFGFLSIGFAQQKGRHISVDFLVSRFSPRMNLSWQIMCNLLGFFFVIALVYYGINGVVHSYLIGEFAPTLTETPLWIPRLAVPLGGILLGLQFIVDIYTGIKKFLLLPQDKSIFLLIPVFLILFIICLYLMNLNIFVGFILLLLLLLFGGIPIYLSMFITGLFSLFLGFGGFNALPIISSVAYSAFDSYSLACLPLFILAGSIIAATGAGAELFNFFEAWFGRIPGGLAIATIFSCAAFAAISCSSVATAATIGLIALPALLHRKYKRSSSYGALAAGGTLGIMIPPAGSLIIYSSFTDESLGRLFMGGFSGGFLIAILFCIYTLLIYMFRRGGYERLHTYSWKERGKATYGAIWVLLFPVIILGGIYTGVFTPLECGAIAVLYALLMPMMRRNLNIKDLPEIISESVVSASIIIAIILGAMTMGYVFTLLRIPNIVLDFINGLGMNPWGVMILLVIFYIIMGMFLEVVSQLAITLPVVYPLVISLGFDGIWFGIFLTILMELSLLTPPVGLNLYVIKGVANDNLWPVIKGSLPYWLLLGIALLLISLFPQLVLWLPSKIV